MTSPRQSVRPRTPAEWEHSEQELRRAYPDKERLERAYKQRGDQWCQCIHRDPHVTEVLAAVVLIVGIVAVAFLVSPK